MRLLKNVNEMYISNTVIIVCILFTSVAMLIDVNNSDTLKDLKGLFIFSYFLRIVVLFIDVFMKDTIRVFGSGSDTEDFFSRMILIASGGEYLGNHMFVRMFGYLFRLIGVSRLYAQYIIVLFSMCSILYTIKSMGLLRVGFESKKMALIFMATLPTYVCLSCILLRESVIYMLISISVYFFVKWYVNGNELDIIIAIIFSLIASIFHSGSIGVALGIIAGKVLFDKKERRIHITLTNMIIGLFLLSLFVYFYRQYGTIFFSKFLRVESLEDIGSTRIKGGSSYAKYVGDSRNPLRMAIYSIPRLFFYLCSPLPFQWRGISDICAFLFNSLFYIYSICKTIVFLYSSKIKSSVTISDRQEFLGNGNISISQKKNSYIRSENNNKKRYKLIRDYSEENSIKQSKEAEQINMVFLLITICVVTGFIFAWGVTNTGTALRHRDKIVSVYILILSLQPRYFSINY